MNKNKNNKTVDDYRSDIFILKNRLKDKLHTLEDLQQKYQDLDVFQEQSYTFHMKTKILENDLITLRQKMNRFTKDQAYFLYSLNYSMLALLRSCEVIGITPQMIFRAVDTQFKGQVNWFDLSSFLRDSMKLTSQFSTPLLQVLDPKQTKIITIKRYLYLTQLTPEMNNFLMQAMQRVTRAINQKKIDLDNLWDRNQLNIVTYCFPLIKKLEKIDILDCIACYCKCDPLKQGSLQRRKAIINFTQKMNDIQNFQKGSLKLKKKQQKTEQSNIAALLFM